MSSQSKTADDSDYFSNPLKYIKNSRHSHPQPPRKPVNVPESSVADDDDDEEDVLGFFSDNDDEEGPMKKRQRKEMDEVEDSVLLEEVGVIGCRTPTKEGFVDRHRRRHSGPLGDHKERHLHKPSPTKKLAMCQSPSEILRAVEEGESGTSYERCKLIVNDRVGDDYDVIMLDLEDTWHGVVVKYATKWGCEMDEVVLSRDGKRMCTEKSLLALGISKDEVIKVVAQKCGIVAVSSPSSLEVKLLLADRTMSKVIAKEEPLLKLRETLAEELSVNRSKLMLAVDGLELKDLDTPNSLGLEDEECIDVIIKH